MTDWDLFQWVADDSAAEIRHTAGGQRYEAERATDDAVPPATVAASAVRVDVRLAVGLAMSVGIASWAARGSMLLASVLVSTPAWRSFDLLPVLSRRRRGDRDGDGDEGDDEFDPDDGEPRASASRRDHKTLDLK